MSKKDVERYYLQMSDQLHEMKENIKDFEELCKNGMVLPERVQQLEDMVKPFNSNFERLSYIMFLLNQPNKKEKVKKYERQIKKSKSKLNPENSTQAVLEENKQVIENIKNLTKN